MGTVAEIKVASPDSATAARALDTIERELARVEAACTIHEATSEVSKVNAAAGSGSPAPVGDDVDATLQLAMDVAAKTKGAFDPTVGPLLSAWGFPESPRLPSPEVLARVRPLVGYGRLARIAASSGGGAWSLRDAGMKIDLGGIACGRGIDAAVEAVREVAPNFLINIGGDIYISGMKPDSSEWTVAIQNPRDPSKFLMTLRARGPLAVSTSGDYEHFVVIDGVRYHHILDPQSGMPAAELCSVTILAPTALLADVWSTTAFVLGMERGLALVESDPDLEGVFVAERPDGTLDVRETSGVVRYRSESVSPSAK